MQRYPQIFFILGEFDKIPEFSVVVFGIFLLFVDKKCKFVYSPQVVFLLKIQ